MRVVPTAIALRMMMALGTRTFFQPDEFFQSLEVAHTMVFKYGHLTWEWQPAIAIRSIVYPFLYVPVYWLLAITRLDDTVLLIYAPKVLNGLFASLTDIWVCNLTRTILGEQYVSTVLLLSLTSFFHGISLTRSMSNSLEVSLTVISLCSYPWEKRHLLDIQRFRKSLLFAALTCVIRPTAAVLWIYMYTLLLWRLRNDVRLLATFIWNAIALSICVTAALLFVDSKFYGRYTFTPLNFLRTNLSSISLVYGSNSWHYYLSQGLPILCTTSLPFVIHGAYNTIRRSQSCGDRINALSSEIILLGSIIWTIGVYSLAGHKEWRFIHQLLPILHLFAGKFLVDLHHSKKRSFATAKKRGSNRPTLCLTLFTNLPILDTHLFLLLLPVMGIIYLTRIHSHAQISVMHYFRALPPGEIQTLGFLMPCHSTPWQAYLHKRELDDPGRLWALTCEPPIFLNNASEYRDQTDAFYDSPIAYLSERFPSQVNLSFPLSSSPISVPDHTTAVVDWQHEWPKYLVIFGSLLHEQGVENLLIRKLGYVEVWRAGNGLEEDRRRRGGVRVLKFSR